MADYHHLSFAAKRQAALDALRPPPMRCPLCGTGVPAPELVAHIERRCTGRPPPHKRDRWIGAADVQRLGMNRSTVRRLALKRGAGAIRARGRGASRQYLERDVVEAIVVRRVFVPAPPRATGGHGMPRTATADSSTPRSTEDPMGKLLSTRQLATQLQVSLRTVRRMRERGLGPPPIRMGRVVRYREEDVQAWLDSKKEHPE